MPRAASAPATTGVAGVSRVRLVGATPTDQGHLETSGDQRSRLTHLPLWFVIVPTTVECACRSKNCASARPLVALRAHRSRAVFAGVVTRLDSVEPEMWRMEPMESSVRHGSGDEIMSPDESSIDETTSNLAVCVRQTAAPSPRE